jgi:hypothetical protein
MEPTQVGSGEVAISTGIAYELDEDEEVVVLDAEELVYKEGLKLSGTVIDGVDINVSFSLKLLPSKFPVCLLKCDWQTICTSNLRGRA